MLEKPGEYTVRISLIGFDAFICLGADNEKLMGAQWLLGFLQQAAANNLEITPNSYHLFRVVYFGSYRNASL